MNLAITGHRPQDLPENWEQTVGRALEQQFGAWLPDLIYVGMAQGVDILAGEIAVKKGFDVVAAVPYDGHCPMAKERRDRYLRLLEMAKETVVVSPGPYAVWKLHARNHYMVDNADIVIAVWSGKKSGGTYECVSYAQKKNKAVVRVNPENGERKLL